MTQKEPKKIKFVDDMIDTARKSAQISLTSAATTIVISNLLLQPTFNILTGLVSNVGKYFSDWFVSRLHIASKDEAFQWVLNWLALQDYTNRTNQLSVFTHVKLRDMVTHYNSAAANKDKHKAPLHYIPAPGVHHVKFENRTIYISYDEVNADKFVTSSSNDKKQPSDLIISCYGWSADILKRFIKFTQEQFIKSQSGKTLIYVPDNFCDIWEARISRQKREPKTVVLNGGLFEELQNDANDFLRQQKYYEDRGCPFRRGYLIHGPPGVGKTSTILAIAGALDLNICVLNLANKNLTDEKLTTLLLNAPPGSIVLLEDIDHALKYQMNKNVVESASQESHEIDDSVSLSGLLNSIDGVIAQEGKIIFMTTNHLEKLPEALIRPGRIDLIRYIDYASAQQMEKLFLKFYPEATQMAKQFVEALLAYQKKNNMSNTVTPAMLQTYFLRFKDTPLKAVELVDTELFSDRQQQGSTTKSI